MDRHAANGLGRLNARLPLADRQAALPAPLRALHRAILAGLCAEGQPPARARLTALVSEAALDDALQRLAADDLVITAGDDPTPLGAYPLTTEVTPHRCRIDGVPVYAMCALDAISVAPMFDVAVEVASQCHVSGRPVHIAMQGERLLTAGPETVQVGIEWSTPCGHAAHSLCLNMIFLADPATAAAWAADGDRTTYDLPQAIAFGTAFFRPLLG